jgi:signal transduction histidine kinase
VANNGPAIPAEDLPHLFKRFYRGQTARQAGEGGTGLGLAICQEIVSRHGGRITVTSEAGGETTFRVWLTLVPKPLNQTEARSDPAESEGGG